MLPNLSSMSLKCCAPVGTSLDEVARGGADEDDEDGAVCSICHEPLTADSTTHPWTGRPERTGRSMRTVCDNDHVFHTGCAVQYVQIKRRNDPSQIGCPDCREPFKPIILELAADIAAAEPEQDPPGAEGQRRPPLLGPQI